MFEIGIGRVSFKVLFFDCCCKYRTGPPTSPQEDDPLYKVGSVEALKKAYNDLGLSERGQPSHDWFADFRDLVLRRRYKPTSHTRELAFFGLGSVDGSGLRGPQM